MDGERSPSPSMRPDHPINNAAFFKKEGVIGSVKKPRTLASVLNKKGKVEGINNSIKKSQLVQPKAHTRNINASGSVSNIPGIKKVSYYSQTLYNQSKRYRADHPEKVLGDTGSVEHSKKAPTKVNKVQPKGVKLAKFDLLDAKIDNSRTKTPKKSTISRVRAIADQLAWRIR